MIGLLVGDALGASVEGFCPEEISVVAEQNGCGAFLNKYIPAIQMGSVTPLRTEIGYRWATEVDDEQFVSPGPTQRAALYPFLRCGHYSDDGNASLALAESLLRRQRLEGADCARSYAEAWKKGGATTRGYPPTAKQVMQAVLDGTDYQVTGLPPHFAFPGGSFANGGAMRISPLALAFRNCGDPALFRAAVAEAIRSSHVHPEAVDGAMVQAQTVRACLLHGSQSKPLVQQWNMNELLPLEVSSSAQTCTPTAGPTPLTRTETCDGAEMPPLPPFDWDKHLGTLARLCETEAMKERLINLRREFRAIGPAAAPVHKTATALSALTSPSLDADFEADAAVLKRLVPNTRPGSGLGFRSPPSTHFRVCCGSCAATPTSGQPSACPESWVAVGTRTRSRAWRGLHLGPCTEEAADLPSRLVVLRMRKPRRLPWLEAVKTSGRRQPRSRKRRKPRMTCGGGLGPILWVVLRTTTLEVGTMR